MSTVEVASVPEPSDDDLDRIFNALANRTRRAMLDRLMTGPSTISDLAEPFEMSLPGASKHVRVLEGAGLVRRRVDGRIHRCTLQPEGLEQADAWITRNQRFWEHQLDSLASHLSKDDTRGTD
ncbi:MAG: metalloregulator ArsR/SmtB family transcription factor [Actinomycetota bacterium]